MASGFATQKAATDWCLQLHVGYPVHDHIDNESDIPKYLCLEVASILENASPHLNIQPRAIFRDLGGKYPNEMYLQGEKETRTYIVICDMMHNFMQRQNGDQMEDVFDFCKWKDAKDLVVHTGYMARNTFTCKEELAAALELPLDTEMQNLRVPDHVHDLLMRMGGPRTLATLLARLCHPILYS